MKRVKISCTGVQYFTKDKIYSVISKELHATKFGKDFHRKYGESIPLIDDRGEINGISNSSSYIEPFNGSLPLNKIIKEIFEENV